ncbi:hypothetical protein GWN42_31320 [candidate division KSB1 bacterium]|nr:hypothetical protein [Phycisphaerae bacterium]NIQ92550.1 hypothetical protein [Deltaproteobacteria bacterium]NIV97160.1 hypothetical protein [candidate division KSB1 bacterium]
MKLCKDQYNNISYVSENSDGSVPSGFTALSQSEIDSFNLDNAFKSKISEIDIKTRSLISAGFEYPSASGQIFSLSDSAQNSLLGLHSAAQKGGILTYPYLVSQLDDKNPDVTIADDAEMITYCQTAFATISYHINAGKTEKGNLRALYNANDITGIKNYKIQ